MIPSRRDQAIKRRVKATISKLERELTNLYLENSKLKKKVKLLENKLQSNNIVKEAKANDEEFSSVSSNELTSTKKIKTSLKHVLAAHNDIIWSVQSVPTRNGAFISCSSDNTCLVGSICEERGLIKCQLYKGHKSSVNCSTFISKDYDLICSGDGSGEVHIWKRNSYHNYPFNIGIEHQDSSLSLKLDILETPIHKINAHKYPISCCIWSEASKEIVSASWDKTICTWDTCKYVNKLKLKGHSGEITSTIYSDNANILYSADVLGNVAIWDTRVGSNSVDKFICHRSEISSISYINEKGVLYTCAKDCSIKMWDAKYLKFPIKVSKFGSPLNSISINQRIDTICTVEDNGHIWFTNMLLQKKFELTNVLKMKLNTLTCSSWVQDSENTLITSSISGDIHLWTVNM